MSWQDDPVVEGHGTGAPSQTPPANAEGGAEVEPNPAVNTNGAPLKVRFLVGLAKNPESQVATLNKYQQDRGTEPDAQFVTIPRQVAEGGTGTVSGRQGVDPHAAAAEKGPTAMHTTLVYTDPESKRPTLVNPPGFDMGDLAAHSRDLARMLAFTGGAAAGGAWLPGGQTTGALTGLASSQATDEFIDRVLGPKLGVVDTRTESQKWTDRGKDLAMEGGSLLAFGAGGKAVHAVGEALTPGAGGMGPGLARLRMPGAAGSGQPEVIDAAKGLGIDTVPAAVTSSSRTVQGLSEAALKNPYTNEATQGAYDKFMEDVRGAWDRDVPPAGAASAPKQVNQAPWANAAGAPKMTLSGAVRKDIAGGSLKQDLSTWHDAAAANTGRMETMMDRIMADQPVDVNDALRFHQYAKEKGADGRFPKELKVAMATAEKNGGMLPWEDTKLARTQVGRELEDADAATRQWLKPMYGHLTSNRDLEDAASTATSGMEGAVNRVGGTAPANWRTMQAFEKQTADEWNEVRAIAEQPQTENAFNMAANSVTQGPSMVKALKGKVSGDTWNRLVSTMFRDKAMVTRAQGIDAAGLQSDAVYSPVALAKYYRDVKKSGSLDEMAEPGTPLRKSIDNQATLGAAMENSRVMRNFSGTATGIRYNEMLEGGVPGEVGSPASMVGGKGAAEVVDKAAGWALNKSLDAFRATNARAQAKLLADPEFTDWMLKSLPLKPRDPAGWNAQMGRLSAIASSKPDLRGELQDFVQNLSNQETVDNAPNPPMDKEEFKGAQAKGKSGMKMPGKPPKS